MVATVLRDPFAALIRKVGYSVGLENTRSRLGDLVELYVRDRQVTTASWRYLVEVEWHLKAPNISDVFSSLGLVSVGHGTVDILYGLDGLAVTRMQVESGKYDDAADAIFCLLLLAADADVFLNCLAVDFDPESVRDILLKMVSSKRQLAHEAIRLGGLREKVDRVINIESQRNNRGSASVGRGVNLLTRTQPLGGELGPLSRPADVTPSVSDDYLRKVPPKRREWAKSIGLFDDYGKSARAQRLLGLLQENGIRNDDGSYGLWPFEPELMGLHLTPATAPWPTISFKGLCDIVEGAFVPDVSRSPTLSYEAQIAVFSRAYADYKSLNLPKSALRGELPLRVARLFQLGWNVANRERLSLTELLENDRLTSRRRVETRSSRLHEGALILRRGE